MVGMKTLGDIALGVSIFALWTLLTVLALMGTGAVLGIAARFVWVGMQWGWGG